jgi:hypothetical protein
MASKTLIEIYEDEYSAFKTRLFDEWAVNVDKAPAIDEIAKRLHKHYLSIACSSRILGERSKRNEYILGIPEAAYVAMIVALRGMRNPASVLLRQCIELALKHVYFSSHPIEYEWTLCSIDYKELTFQFLIDYWTRTIQYKEIGGASLYSKLQSEFSTLSRYVHVHSKKFMGYAAMPIDSSGTYDVVKTFSAASARVWPPLTMLLIANAPQKYLRASTTERRIIRNVLPAQIRVGLDNYIRSLQ